MKMLKIIYYIMLFPFIELGKCWFLIIDETDTKLFDPKALKLSRKELDEIVEQEKKRFSQ